MACPPAARPKTEVWAVSKCRPDTLLRTKVLATTLFSGSAFVSKPLWEIPAL